MSSSSNEDGRVEDLLQRFRVAECRLTLELIESIDDRETVLALSSPTKTSSSLLLPSLNVIACGHPNRSVSHGWTSRARGTRPPSHHAQHSIRTARFSPGTLTGSGSNNSSWRTKDNRAKRVARPPHVTGWTAHSSGIHSHFEQTAERVQRQDPCIHAGHAGSGASKGSADLQPTHASVGGSGRVWHLILASTSVRTAVSVAKDAIPFCFVISTWTRPATHCPEAERRSRRPEAWATAP